MVSNVRSVLLTISKCIREIVREKNRRNTGTIIEEISYEENYIIGEFPLVI